MKFDLRFTSFLNSHHLKEKDISEIHKVCMYMKTGECELSGLHNKIKIIIWNFEICAKPFKSDGM